MANAYTEDSIKTLSPLEHIRLRPAVTSKASIVSTAVKAGRYQRG